MQEVNELFHKYDAAQDRSVLESLRGVLNRRRYIQNLMRDVEKALSK
jgi:hypothetical protein